MCTVTWAYTGDSYTLHMNRDELHTRGPALPPQLRVEDGVRYLAPIDSDGGGTWVAVNEHGVTVGLLNRYPAGFADQGSGNYESRGKLVLELALKASAASVMQALETRALSGYRPFTVFALDPHQILTCAWDGSTRTRTAAPRIPLSSSSFRGDEVVGERLALLEQLGRESELSTQTLRAYHASHDPERGAFSVCMKRPDAATKSYCEILVKARTVRFLYHPGAPCDDALDSTHTLDRRAEGRR